MNTTDHVDGAPYVSGRPEDAVTEWDFYGGDATLSENTSNSQRSFPNGFITASVSGPSTSVNTELYHGQLSGASTPERGKGRDGYLLKNREGSAAGVSAGRRGKQTRTSGGSLASLQASSLDNVRLPNGKLQCDVCGMTCQGPNVLMVHKRSHTGERPFRCEECGAAFTQKGNLLRHTKLHSGEKPFKCPHCNYACRRRDALAGHLRTHEGLATTCKSFKCSNCGRSYKQQNVLEEHRERCQSSLHSLENPTVFSGPSTQEKQSQRLGSMREPELQSSTETLPLISHLANSITKRKSSTPQKFLGGKHMMLAMQDACFEFPLGSKEGDRCSLHPERDFARRVGMVSRHPTRSKVRAEDQGSLTLEEPQLSCLGKLVSVTPVSSSMAPDRPWAFNYGRGTGGGGASGGWEVDEDRSHSQGCHDSTNTDSRAEESREEQKVTLEEPQLSCLGKLVSVTPVSSSMAPDRPWAFNYGRGTGGGGASGGWEVDEDRSHSQGCHDSTNTDSRAEESREEQKVVSARVQSNNPPTTATVPNLRASLGVSLSHNLNGKRRPNVSTAARRAPDWALSSIEEVQVVDRKGEVLCTFRCEHCHILFLDHVMFTLHMGCHGFRRPLECNVCGHRSRDRYEFTCHIVRGEHVLRKGTHPKTRFSLKP